MPPKSKIPPANSNSPTIPKAKSNSENKHWVFSFKFWSQMENFGLNNSKVDVAWFTSLLGRLKDLSHKTIEEITTNPAASDAWRYHKINWSQKNIPITKAEFEKLVPPKLITEDTDICQFMVSKANGRVVGFFDHEQTFQIVLLDSLHNIQPSKDFNYAVNPTKISLTEIEEHQQKLQLLKKEIDGKCKSTDCNVRESISQLMQKPVGHRFFCLNDLLKEDEIQKLTTKYGSIENIVLEAITKL